MSNEFTETEAKELGVQKELLDQWMSLMQDIWRQSIQHYRLYDNDAGLCPKNGENEIIIGGMYRITAHIVNNKYIECDLRKGETQLAVVRYTGSATPIFRVIVTLIMADLKK